MKSELVQLALEKVGNINTLINLVARRVRQLSAGGGGISRPLVTDTASLGAADIALREIIEEKMGWDMPALEEWSVPVKRRRARPKTGAKTSRAPSTPVAGAVAL